MAGASHGLSFRLPARRSQALAPRATASSRHGAPPSGRAAAIGTAALATTALNAIPGTPADEIVMATAYTLTGILGHLAPLLGVARPATSAGQHG